MRSKNILIAFCALFSFLLFSSQPESGAQSQEPTLESLQTSLSLTVRQALQDSKLSMLLLEEQSNLLQQRLSELENLSEMQSMELTELSSLLTATTDSFNSLYREYESLNRQAELYQQKIKARNRILFWFSAIAVLMLSTKIAELALHFRGIAIPTWLKLII